MNLSLVFIIAYSINLVSSDDIMPLMRDRLKLRFKPIPWIGVLLVKQDNAEDAATGIVLIGKKLAIANAGEVSMIEKETMRSTTIAQFYKNPVDTPLSCFVEDYIVHPEYNDEVLNTIALVKLDPGFSGIYWSPITWPKRFYKPQKNVFVIGFTDFSAHNKLEQVVYRMIPYNKTSCVKFYKKEGLDFKTYWPSHYMCLKVQTNATCVFDSGMALATNSSGEWVLLGLSTNGPGCKLPSRHTEFFPYIPWIEANADTDDVLKTMSLDRRWMSDPFLDKDTVELGHLDNKTIVLRPENANINHTDCDHVDGEIMYRENGYFLTGPRKPATAVYSLSFFDLVLNKVTCVSIRVNCSEMSEIVDEWHRGFQQDFFEDAIKAIPIVSAYQTVPPKILYVKENLEQYHNLQIRNVFFKFKFVGVATIDVMFFGKHAESATKKTTPTPTTTDPTYSTTRSRSRPTRKYGTHFGKHSILRNKARKNTNYW